MNYILINLNCIPQISATYYFHCSKGYDTGFKDINDVTLELTYIDAGEWDMQIIDEFFSIVPGQLCIFPPKATRRGIATDDIKHEHRSIYIGNIRDYEVISCDECRNKLSLYNENFFRDYNIGKLTIFLPLVHDPKHFIFNTAVFQQIINEYNSTNLYSKYKASALLYELLLRLSAQCISDLKIGFKDYEKSASLMTNVLSYINQNFNTIKSINEIAEYLNYNPNYLSTLFKNSSGTTIINYINKLKIEKAKQLIKDEKIPFSEIAKLVGISDIYYMSKLFKRHVGITMTEYSKMFPLPMAKDEVWFGSQLEGSDSGPSLS